ncbi:MAG TPA: CARDB domain-containing protein [Tepidisphaeraceae bacterium]|nr:CARDB domain-containing protein [Tepidisphaeraceae bacterium]
MKLPSRRSVPCVETMESRMMLSAAPASTATLTASLSGALPTSVIAGQKATIHQKVTISSDEAINTTVTVNVSLSTSATFDSTNAVSVPLTLTKPLHLAAGKSTSIPITLKSLPSTVPAGTYHLQVEAAPASGATTADASSATTMSIVAPFIDLSAAFAKTPTTVKLGRRVVVGFYVTNDGNIPAVGRPKFQVGASANGQVDANTVIIGTFLHSINIKPGKSTLVRFASVPKAKGTFYLIAAADLNDIFNETNIDNNVIIAKFTTSIV